MSAQLTTPILDKFQQEYVGGDEAAEITGYTTRWFRYQRARNLPPVAIRVGDRFFYRKSDLEAFKKQKKNNDVAATTTPNTIEVSH